MTRKSERGRRTADSFMVPTAPESGLNAVFIRNLKPRPDGGMYEVADRGDTAYLRIRVTPRTKTFYMRVRWKEGAVSATSRALGEFSEQHSDLPGFLSLAQAREKGRQWDRMRKAGMDPQEKMRQDREAEERALQEDAAAPARTFRALTEAYLARQEFKDQRQQNTTERAIRYNLLSPERNPWLDRNVSEIDDEDVAAVIAAIRDRPAPSQASHVLNHVRQIFNVGMMPENRKRYQLKAHPIAHLREKAFGLKPAIRRVLLEGDEIVAFWWGAEALGYPVGPFYQLLLVTGQRKSDISNAIWPEFDLAERLFTIPEKRFKSKVQQLVPLSDLALAIVSALPRFEGENSGDFLFSHCRGLKPINGFSKAKVALDKSMLTELRKLAVARGDDPAKVTLKHFVNHDSRRVVRSQLAELGVPDNVAELIIGHGKKGIERVYNQFKYLKPMREAQQAWADRLRAIVGLKPTA